MTGLEPGNIPPPPEKGWTARSQSARCMESIKSVHTVNNCKSVHFFNNMSRFVICGPNVSLASVPNMLSSENIVIIITR